MRARYGPVMKSARLLFAVLAATVSVVPSALAHHTVANSYDVSKIVVLKGVVTSVLWANPHVVYHLAVRGGDGSPVDWAIESRHLQGMRDDGVERDTITVGDTVTMNALVALDGSHRAATASMILPNGRAVRVCTVTYDKCP